MRASNEERNDVSIKLTQGLCLSLALLTLAGCRATPPSKAETKVATWTKHHITIHGKHDANPLKPTAENIADGQDSFTSYCMVCHGLDGQNTGVPFADTLSPPVPSLASPQVQAYTDGQLHWIIKNGIWPSGMPPSDGEFSDREMWEMVLYIRHLPPAGRLGAPKVYSGSTK
jgi:mono/diheme cytochrome c family protein